MTPIRQMNLKNGYTVDWLMRNWEQSYDLVEADMHDISRRLREYDPTYFIIRSKVDGHHEVHNTENVGATYCLTIPYLVLDERTLELVRQTDIQRIGAKARLAQILEEDRLAEEADKKQTRAMAEGLAQETHYHWKEAFKLA